MADDTLKTVNLRALTEDQLNDKLVALKKEQFNLRFQKAIGQMEKTARVRVVRRGVAKVKTILAEKKAG